MSTFKQRSDYFKIIAHNNKFIAHERPVEYGSDKLRKSFHRINDEDELNASCSKCAHFPCVVHIVNDVQYKQNGTGIPRKIIRNHLYFLAKAANPLTANAIENAYDEAHAIMSQFISYMVNEVNQDECCGNNLFLFDVNKAQSDMIGPINTALFGWYLIFEDETKADELIYNEENWIID